MPHQFSKRLGKLLFPHLPKDQRKQQLTNIALVILFSLTVAGTIALIMIHAGKR